MLNGYDYDLTSIAGKEDCYERGLFYPAHTHDCFLDSLQRAIVGGELCYPPR